MSVPTNSLRIRVIVEEHSEIPVSDPYGIVNDPKMPFLTQALDPSFMTKTLHSTMESFCGGKKPFKLTAIRAVRYKRERRCLIEYDIEYFENHDSGENKITIIGKVNAKGINKKIFNLSRIMWKGGFGANSQDGIEIPEPLGMIPELHMCLQQKVAGKVATHILQTENAPSCSQRIVEAIWKLHRANFPIKRRHTIEDEMAILEDRLEKAETIHPQWKSRISKVLSQCNAIASAMPTSEPRGIHRDFYPDQVLVHGSKIYLIDFDLFCQGDTALDIGNFLGHLIEQRIRTRKKENILKDQEDKIQEHYVRLAGNEMRNSIEVYKILTLVRHIYISTLFPDRKQFTESILRRCETYLQKKTESII